MKPRCTAVFLSFVTEGNRSIRHELFKSCFPSFEKFKEENLQIQTVLVDNVSIEAVRNTIKESKHIDVHYLLDKNMFDTALFCAGLDAAEMNGSEYILFTYDDFFIYDPHAVLDVIDFMDVSGVDCTRVTEYSVKDSRRFDTDFTPKTSNPDAIRHTNTATGKKIEHEFYGKFGESDFFLTNWHYTSRPSVWRTSKLKELISNQKDLKILQGFEGFMVKACQNAGVSFATLDKGMMRTFPVQLSARTSPDFVRSVDEVNHTVSQEAMKDSLIRCRVLK